MPERVLQNDNCVAALQQPTRHSVLMGLRGNDHRDEPPARTWRTATRARARTLFAWLALAPAVVAIALLTAGCGGGSSGEGVAGLRTTTTTATAPATPAGGGKSSPNPVNTALAFGQCMRTHGEPDFPEPVFHGHSAQITLHPGSGVDPNSPQFAAATKACKHLLPSTALPGAGQTITAADQKDYLEAAACMRAHGVLDFPDPSFEHGTVSFTTQTPIDTNSSQYKSALATCQKLVPAGLPYSASGP